MRSAIRAQLITVLKTLPAIEVVYDHEPQELGSYPAACVTNLESQGAFISTGANEHTYAFMVRLYYRTDDPTYENILEGVYDQIEATLEHNVTLNGSCDWAMPVEDKWLYQTRELPVRVAEITVKANKIGNR